MKQDLSFSTWESESAAEGRAVPACLWKPGDSEAHIHWSPEAFSLIESSIKMQKSPSQPDICQRPAGSSGVLDLASSPWIHSSCHSPTICPNSQPSSLDRLSPSLCMFTTKSFISCYCHWLISLSLLILQCHEIYDSHRILLGVKRNNMLILHWVIDLNL